MKLTAKLALLTAILLLGFRAQADTPSLQIDLNLIGVEVTGNPSHYRELSQRFEQGDTTMTLPEIATVYYGYSFTPNYQPTDHYDEIVSAYEAKDYETTARMVKEALTVNPVSLDLLVLGSLSANHLHTDEGRTDALRYRRQVSMLIDMIFETGTGIISESPFYVICDGDIYRILHNIMGVDNVIGKSGLGALDAYKFTFAGSPREHILYFNNTRQHAYESGY